MYFNLALRNVRKSIKAYWVYFLTLSLTVCIFYTFNSILYQKEILEQSKVFQLVLSGATSYVKGITGITSIFLVGLIGYANYFMIQFRKREFGIYLSLGMGKVYAAILLFFEMMIIGFFGFITGALSGIIFSQALPGLTAKLFDINDFSYRFVFSIGAFTNTAVCFTGVFLLAALLDFIIVYRYKTVKLLSFIREGRTTKSQSKLTLRILFLVSLLLIGSSYYLVMKNGIVGITKSIWGLSLFCLVGTFLFYRTLAELIIQRVKDYPKVYLRGLNMLLVRRFSQKLNLNCVLITIVSLLMSVAMCLLMIGFSLKSSFEKNADFISPFDATMSMNTDSLKSVEDHLKSVNISIDDFSESYITYFQYDSLVGYQTIFDEAANIYMKNTYGNMKENSVLAIKQSDFNQMMKMQGKEQIQLKQDETIFLSNNRTFFLMLYRYSQLRPQIIVDERSFKVKGTIYESIETSVAATNYMMLILPDEAVKHLVPRRSILSLNYLGDKEEAENKITDEYERQYAKNTDPKLIGEAVTKQLSLQVNRITAVLIAYTSIFIALVLLLISCVVLYIRQMIELPEKLESHNVLQRMGAKGVIINRIIVMELLIYFLSPFFLATLYSISGQVVLWRELSAYELTHPIVFAFYTFVTSIMIYGGYFIVIQKQLKGLMKY